MRKYNFLLLLGFLLFTFSLLNSYFAFGLTIDVNDAENDVYFSDYMDYLNFTARKTGLHDEIDIQTLSVDGQNITLTFYGNIDSWVNTENITTGVIIALYDDFDFDYYKTNKQAPFPFYAVQYTNWSIYLPTYPSGGYNVYFLYCQDEYNIFFWNGTYFVENETSAISIGYVTQNSIFATVPTGGFTILDNSTYIAQSIYVETFGSSEMNIYTDFAPEKFNLLRKSENKIPSYELFIFISTLLGITLIIIKMRISRQSTKKIR